MAPQAKAANTKLGAAKADVWNQPAGDAGRLRSLLEAPVAMERIRSVAAKHLTAERLLNISLSVINSPSKGSMRLLDATPASILQCIVQLAEVGLEPGGVLQHAYLVPYRDGARVLAKVMFGYRGLVELARRSGKILQVEAREVYEKDEFSIVYGFNQELRHVPELRKPAGEPYVAYAIARFTDGGIDFGHMTKEAIYKIRDRSEGYLYQKNKGGSANPWITDEIEMWKKTVIRQRSKLWPQSKEMQRAEEIEAANDEADLAIDVTPPRPFQVVDQEASAPPPPAPEPVEDAEVVDEKTGEVSGGASAKMDPGAYAGEDPFSQLIHSVLTAKNQDELDALAVEGDKNKGSMGEQDLADFRRAVEQRETELRQ